MLDGTDIDDSAINDVVAAADDADDADGDVADGDDVVAVASTIELADLRANLEVRRSNSSSYFVLCSARLRMYCLADLSPGCRCLAMYEAKHVYCVSKSGCLWGSSLTKTSNDFILKQHLRGKENVNCSPLHMHL